MNRSKPNDKMSSSDSVHDISAGGHQDSAGASAVDFGQQVSASEFRAPIFQRFCHRLVSTSSGTSTAERQHQTEYNTFANEQENLESKFQLLVRRKVSRRLMFMPADGPSLKGDQLYRKRKKHS